MGFFSGCVIVVGNHFLAVGVSGAGLHRGEMEAPAGGGEGGGGEGGGEGRGGGGEGRGVMPRWHM